MKESVKLTIEGMHCDGCVRRVTAALQKVEGVERVEVQVGAAQVERAGDRPEAQELIDAVNKLGFTARES